MVKSSAYDLNLIFKALADPTRRAILRNLSGRERAISALAKPHRMSLAAVSKHLKVLERARLVHRRWNGNYCYLSLNADALKSAEQWISYYEQFWDARLDALKNYLEKETS